MLALIGGHFGALRILFGFFISMWVPLIAGLNIVQKLFWVDQNKARWPQSKKAMDNKSLKELHDEALETIKGRKRLQISTWQKFQLGIEAHFKNFTFCRKSKFTRMVMGEGLSKIKAELDIYNYLKKARLVDAMSKHLLTFNH